ncbi:MAG: ATP-binding cassette domain-containing protein [Spartobacteria bacterium]|nr:ATP-binding cassette domain-containing protein [Spartobacteria bacterium]
MQTYLLEFSDVSVSDEENYDAGLSSVSFTLAPGELLMLHAEKQQQKLPLFDAAQGLVDPAAGVVTYRQQSWREMSPDTAAVNRASMGRVFEAWGWVSNLDVDENITLKARHWMRRTAEDVEPEAVALARRFGLDDLPRVRPARLSRSILQRAQWVRALLGTPELLLLAYPEQYVERAHVDALMELLAERLAQGVSAVWCTRDKEIWNAAAPKGSARYRMRGSDLIKESEA